MLCLLTQPQEELQLNLKTSNTQNCQKIQLHGSLTTKDLKKPHSSRWVEGKETWSQAERLGDMVWHREEVAVANEQSYIYVWWLKTGRNTLGTSNPSPRPDHTGQGSSTGK